ncbi:MAG: hypothetical protein ACRD5M_01140 [Candidatus Acidiferrales bacterium]
MEVKLSKGTGWRTGRQFSKLLSMARSKEQLEVMLREQMGLLRTSLDSFYAGNFAESLRIATAIRVLVHETGSSKPLLKQARPDGLDLQIKEHVGEAARPDEEEVFSFAVGIRMGPGPALAPAVDLDSSHNTMSSVGAWWNRTVFTFRSQFGRQLIYTRKKVVLTLANKEGGAHVDPDEDADYVRLLTNEPLTFSFQGAQIETPDLARFLTAQSGVEMLECLKRNCFPDVDVPPKWEFGTAPPIAIYFDQISGRLVTRVVSAFPRAEMRITKRH